METPHFERSEDSKDVISKVKQILLEAGLLDKPDFHEKDQLTFFSHNDSYEILESDSYIARLLEEQKIIATDTGKEIIITLVE